MITLKNLANGLVCGLAVWCSQASALEITYRAVDIVDAVPGVDRWRYDYTLIGSLGDGEGVTLLFDPATYSGLDFVTSSFPQSFGVYVLEPDANSRPPAEGLVTITAGEPIADMRFSFSVAFNRLAGGAPGVQGYEVFGADFSVRPPLLLTSPVPEPTTAALFLAAVALLMPVMRRQRLAPH